MQEYGHILQDSEWGTLLDMFGNDHPLPEPLPLPPRPEQPLPEQIVAVGDRVADKVVVTVPLPKFHEMDKDAVIAQFVKQPKRYAAKTT